MTRSLKFLISMAEHFERIKHSHKLPFRIVRTRAGKHQLAAGSWSWVLVDSEKAEILASGETVSTLMKAFRIDGIASMAVEYNRTAWGWELWSEPIRRVRKGEKS